MVHRWRVVVAVAAGAITAGVVFGGLASWAVAAQAGVLAGVTVGLVAPSRATAAAGVCAAALGHLLAPQNAWTLTAATGQWVVEAVVACGVAAAVAVGVRGALGRMRRSGPLLVGLAVGMMLANLWANTLTVNGTQTYDPISGQTMPSFNAQLAGAVPESIAASDDAWYLRVFSAVRDRRDYYPEFASALDENPRWEPYSVIAFRMPTLFLAARVLPPTAMPVVFLVLASIAVASVVPATTTVTRAPLALPACAALAAYFGDFPIQLHLFSPECWAAAIGVPAMATTLVSYRSSRWKTWWAAGCALAVLATLVRETIVFLPLGLVAAALVAAPVERRFRVSASLACLITLGVAYLAHYLAVRPFLSTAVSGAPIARGSLANAAAAVVYGTDLLGGVNALVIVLAIAGVVGALAMPDASRRLLAAVGTIAPLLSFLVLGNGAWYETTGAQVNYWGGTVVPLLYMLVPVAFTMAPGIGKAVGGRRPGAADATGSHGARPSGVGRPTPVEARTRALRYTPRMNMRPHTLLALLAGRLIRPAAV